MCRADGPKAVGRASGILSIRGPEVSRESPRVVLDVGKRLRRMRGRFHRWIPMRTGPQPDIGLEHKSDNFSIQSSMESPKNRRMRRRGPPDLRPIPEGDCEPV